MQTYRHRVKEIHRELGISGNYEFEYGLSLKMEETELVEIGNDIYGRPQRLASIAAVSWENMKSQALKEEVILNVVSAFRAVDRQMEII